MKKTLVILLSIVLFVLLMVAGSIAYLYTDNGNARLQAYLEHRIAAETGLPVTFRAFRLERGHLYFVATLGTEASLGFDGGFDLLRRRVDGRYLLKADHFHYQGIPLRQARVNGTVRGTIDDLHLEGKGSLLDGPLAFRVTIQKQQPKDLTIQVRRLPLEELLALGGQPPIAHGQIHADIFMPDIGREGSRGKATIQLAQGRLDSVVIRRLYHYTLPPDKNGLHGAFHAVLEGNNVRFDGNIVSALLKATIQKGRAQIAQKSARCDIALDASDLAPVSQGKLRGPMKLNGAVVYDAKGLRLRGMTRSLGGTIDLDYTQAIAATLKGVSLAKVLTLLGQPAYARGLINGSLSVESPQGRKGAYQLSLKQGTLQTKILNKQWGTHLPAPVSLAFDSNGTFDQGVLHARGHVHSNLLDATVRSMRWTLADGTLQTDYRIALPDPLALTGKKSAQKIPVTLSGKVSKAKKLRITGEATGLGKQLRFAYTGRRLTVEGKGVQVGRLLASMGQPAALSGGMDVHLDLAPLQPMSGTISLRAPRLSTHPQAMKQLLGKPLATTLALQMNGQAKKGTLYAKASLQSPLASLELPRLVWTLRGGALHSPYRLTLPHLSQLEPLIGIRLKGPFAATGTVKAGKTLDIQGQSTSLGGTTHYRYHGSRLEARLQGVPLPRLLRLADQPEKFLGTVNGTVSYDTHSHQGKAAVRIDRFQFKPGKLTTAVKLVLRKDLAQIIYDRSDLKARFNGDIIDYTLTAKGKRSDFSLEKGRLNTQARTHQARFALRIDQTDVEGTVRGPIKDPKISVIPGKLMREKLKKKVIDKIAPGIQKKINKATGGAVGNVLKKLPKLF